MGAQVWDCPSDIDLGDGLHGLMDLQQPFQYVTSLSSDPGMLTGGSPDLVK